VKKVIFGFAAVSVAIVALVASTRNREETPNPSATAVALQSPVKWEYKVFVVDRKNSSTAEEEFQKLGADGWELVTGTVFGSGFANYTYIFKRRSS